MLTFDSFNEKHDATLQMPISYKSDVTIGMASYKNRIVNGDMAIDTINLGKPVQLMSAFNIQAASNLIAQSNLFSGIGMPIDASSAVKALEVYNTRPRTGAADLQQIANLWGAGNMWAGGVYEAQCIDVLDHHHVDSVNQLPEGIKKAHKFSVVEKNDSGKQGHGVILSQSIDRQNVWDILSTWGYPNGVAMPLTISFYFCTSVASTYYLNVQNSDKTMSFVRPFDIYTPHFWQLVSLTVPAPQIGGVEAWAVSGLIVSILDGCFDRAATLRNRWVDVDALTLTSDFGRFVLGEPGDHVLITACQLEAGPVATAFEQRPPEVENKFVNYYSSNKYAVIDSAVGQGNLVCSGSLSAANMGPRNMVVNGDFQVDPYGSKLYPLVAYSGSPVISYDFSTFSTMTSGATTEGLWSMAVGRRSSMILQMQKSSVGLLKGITSALRVHVSSPVENPVIDKHLLLSHVLQPCVTNGLGWGTPSASSITVSFWIFSNVATSFCLSLRSTAAGTNTGAYASLNTPQRVSFVTDFSLPASAWTQVTKTIPGETKRRGSWSNGMTLTLTSGCGLVVGSAAPTKDKWVLGNFVSLLTDKTRSFVGTKGAYLLITAVQVERGTVATPFEVGEGPGFEQGPIAKVTTTPVHMSRGIVDTSLIMVQGLSQMDATSTAPVTVYDSGFTPLDFPSTVSDMNLNFLIRTNPEQLSYTAPYAGIYSITFTLECTEQSGICEARIMKHGSMGSAMITSVLSSGLTHVGFQTITTTALLGTEDSVAFGVFLRNGAYVKIGPSKSMTMTLLQRHC
jgi:hypothetical protein